MHGILLKFTLRESTLSLADWTKSLVENFPGSLIIAADGWAHMRQHRRDVIARIEASGHVFSDARRLIETVDDAERRHGPKARISLLLGRVTLVGEVSTAGMLLTTTCPVAEENVEELLHFLKAKSQIIEREVF